MARRTADEPCMFCTPDTPCQIHAPKVPQRRAKQAPPLPAKVSQPSAEKDTGEDALVDITSVIGVRPSAALSSGDASTPLAVKRDVAAAMRAHVRSVPTPDPIPERDSDPVIDDAIRALAPILHPTERRQYQAVIDEPRTIQRRAAAWRNRQRGS